MDRVIVNPLDVRGLGDIVSPKSSNDFFDYNSITVSSTDSTYGTVYTDSYRSGAKITLTADTVIGVDAESFTVSVGLKDHSNNTLNGATVHLVVNDVDSTATTSSGTASFTVTCDGSKVYRLKAYYIGSSNDGGCFANHTVYVADADNLDLFATSNIIQSGTDISLIGVLTGEDGTGKTMGVPGQTVNFYQEWTPGIKLDVEANLIQSGTGIDLSAQLYDTSDGSLIRQSGYNTTFMADYPQLTFTKLYGSANPSYEYNTDDELVFTCASGGDTVLGSMVEFQADSWECSFDMKATGTDGGNIGIIPSSNDKLDGKGIRFKPQNNDLSAQYNNTNTSSDLVNQHMVMSYNTYHTLKITASEGTLKVYADGTLKKTYTDCTWLGESLRLGLGCWTTGNVIYVKDFVFKCYME